MWELLGHLECPDDLSADPYFLQCQLTKCQILSMFSLSMTGYWYELTTSDIDCSLCLAINPLEYGVHRSEIVLAALDEVEGLMLYIQSLMISRYSSRECTDVEAYFDFCIICIVSIVVQGGG